MLNIGENLAIFRLLENMLFSKKRLKLCLSRNKVSFELDEKILSNPGVLLDFKQLKAPNSMSWRKFSSKSVSETLKYRVKSLEEFGIQDANFVPISVKNLLKLFAICL